MQCVLSCSIEVPLAVVLLTKRHSRRSNSLAFLAGWVAVAGPQKFWSECICARKPLRLMVASFWNLLGDVVRVEKLFLYCEWGT